MDPFRELELRNTYEQFRSWHSQINLLQYCHRTSRGKKKKKKLLGHKMQKCTLIKFMPHDLNTRCRRYHEIPEEAALQFTEGTDDGLLEFGKRGPHNRCDRPTLLLTTSNSLSFSSNMWTHIYKTLLLLLSFSTFFLDFCFHHHAYIKQASP